MFGIPCHYCVSCENIPFACENNPFACENILFYELQIGKYSHAKSANSQFAYEFANDSHAKGKYSWEHTNWQYCISLFTLETFEPAETDPPIGLFTLETFEPAETDPPIGLFTLETFEPAETVPPQGNKLKWATLRTSYCSYTQSGSEVSSSCFV